MKMERVLIQLPKPLKAKLDALRAKGYTVSGFIQHLLEREFNHAPKMGRKGGYTHGTRRQKRSRSVK